MKQNFFHRYLFMKILPIRTILLVDIFIIVASCLLAYSLRYDFRNVFLDSSTIDKTTLWTIVANLIFFRVFRIYPNVLRFSSFVDIVRILVSLTVSYGVPVILSVLLDAYLGVRIGAISVLLMAYVINSAMMAYSRIVVKMFFEVLNFDGGHTTNIFIYGIKEIEMGIAKSLRVSLRDHYRLRGSITGEPELIDRVMMEAKMFPSNELLVESMNDRDMYTIIASPAKMEKLKKSDMIDALLSNNVRLLTAPPLSKWGGQSLLNKTQLKGIRAEDLLQREPIEVNIHKIASHLEGKRMMITNAADSIGSEITRQIVSFNLYKLTLIDRAETSLHNTRLELQGRWRDIDAGTIVVDMSNTIYMEAIFREYKSQYIFHATAYKHVPMMRDNVSESIQVNVPDARTLAGLAVKFGSEKFVTISTDKAVSPTNVMGCPKRICEIYVQSLTRKLRKESAHSMQFITARFGSVLGSNSPVIPRFRDQIQRGNPVTVTHPGIIHYFMTMPEVCRLVLEADGVGNGGEIYISDMGRPVKTIDLVKRVISLSGHTDVRIEFTGLRHGGKLYEGLLNMKELTEPTCHEKVMIATIREYDYDEVRERAQELIDVSYTYDQMKIVVAMENIVPEFVSKNSCFKALDRKG